jgi:thiol-disulfide isomerase/thioredoxin
VILDFWTFCCVNCLHVLDELRELEEKYRDVLVIVGVHSPKFAHEADPDALVAAVSRYEVHHPVLDDPTLITWSAYTARAWPTLVVIDPEGTSSRRCPRGHRTTSRSWSRSSSPRTAAILRFMEAGATPRRADNRTTFWPAPIRPALTCQSR